MNNLQVNSEAPFISVCHILKHCGNLLARERVLILYDVTTFQIASLFIQASPNKTSTQLMEVVGLNSHGQEPSAQVLDAMCNSDLIVCLTQFSMAHSQARKIAGTHGAGFLSLPLYTLDLLSNPCLMVDYKSLSSTVRRFADGFTAGDKVLVTSEVGTQIELSIVGRQGNYCPGFVVMPGDLGSPPDIEANVSPIETESNGVIVVDGSITHPSIGLLTDPILLKVSNGAVNYVTGKNKDMVKLVNELLGEEASLRRVVAECGVGLNPLAELTGTMLTDEGSLGCVHFGLGSNYTVGGRNNVNFHLDFVIRKASIFIDGKSYLKAGSLC